jgi:hypothetical protein
MWQQKFAVDSKQWEETSAAQQQNDRYERDRLRHQAMVQLETEKKYNDKLMKDERAKWEVEVAEKLSAMREKKLAELDVERRRLEKESEEVEERELRMRDVERKRIEEDFQRRVVAMCDKKYVDKLGKWNAYRGEEATKTSAMQEELQTTRELLTAATNKSNQLTDHSDRLRLELLWRTSVSNEVRGRLRHYKILLKFTTVSKYVKDFQLKKKLLLYHNNTVDLLTKLSADAASGEQRNEVLKQSEVDSWLKKARAIDREFAVARRARRPVGLHSPTILALIANLLEVEAVLKLCCERLIHSKSDAKSAMQSFFDRNVELQAVIQNKRRQLELEARKVREFMHAVQAIKADKDHAERKMTWAALKFAEHNLSESQQLNNAVKRNVKPAGGDDDDDDAGDDGSKRKEQYDFDNFGTPAMPRIATWRAPAFPAPAPRRRGFNVGGDRREAPQLQRPATSSGGGGGSKAAMNDGSVDPYKWAAHRETAERARLRETGRIIRMHASTGLFRKRK